jgi:asparagine synthase (glutamine-hydrolysing)
MGYMALSPELLHEARYPYHDRDLREFAYAIPREQLVRVGQRRSLMKRALVGIVPDEILNRRQKSFDRQERKKALSTAWPTTDAIGQYLVSTFIGIVDPNRFLDVLQEAHRLEEVPLKSLKRTLTIESWLRHLRIQGILTNATTIKKVCDSESFADKELRSSAQSNSSAS